jgi:hypothetical protein
MKRTCRLIFVVAIALAGVSCDKKPKAADSGTDDAKLRPELAVARKGASPTPMPNEAKTSPTPTP